MVDVGDDVETGIDVGVDVVPMSMTFGIDTCGVELAAIAMPRTNAVTSTAAAARPRHAHRRSPVFWVSAAAIPLSCTTWRPLAWRRESPEQPCREGQRHDESGDPRVDEAKGSGV